MEGPLALREWAVAVEALASGRQVIVLRKGGIAEETKEFKVESPRFYLFPSYEHQKPHLMKEEARATVLLTQEEALANPDTVRIAYYAEVVHDLEVTDEETLQRLDALHVWTHDYAAERLKWKRTKPLHVLVLRVYAVDNPLLLPLDESFGGCKSWLQIPPISPSAMHPVLTDEQFDARVDEVLRCVNG
ncbi:DUF1802 family protein [Cohnella yongneupensis]|uniref:DUF1802 family protein n=1 Tax=Cohnella yongneupensis TaxID=425006 RepID=A0ABW0R0K7_9BACL